MQCTSYIPVYYPERDFNVGESGFSWHLFSGDANHGEERGCNISVSRCMIDQYLGYEKEVLRRIIQKHEATFRYQVQELHRLYRRQTELMDDISVREIFSQHLQLQRLESDICLSQTRSDISQASHTTSWFLGDRSDMLTAENIQGPPTSAAASFKERITLRPGRLLSYNEVQAPFSRSKECEKRTLDLELPAVVYHNDEEGGQFEEGNVSEAPEVKCVTPKKLPDVQPASDSVLGSVKTRDLSSFNVSSRKTKLLIDLNETMQIEPTSSSSLETCACFMEIMHNDPHVAEEARLESVVPKHCGLVNCDRSSDGRNSSVAIDLNSVPLGCLSEAEISFEVNKDTEEGNPEEKLHQLTANSAYNSGVLCSSRNERPLGSDVEILALTYSYGDKDNENVDKAVVLDCISTHDHDTIKRKCVKDDPVVDTRIADKFLKIRTFIDLNTGVVGDEPSPRLPSTNVGIKSAGETDLEAPVSPENKEGSPPRGKSEEIPLEIPILSEQGEELDRIAAQTLIMIFSSEVEEHSKAVSNEPLGNFNNCLSWFADIVSSTRDDLENEVVKLQTDIDHGELVSNGIDDFVATALNPSKESAINLSHIIKKEKETDTFSSRSRRDHATKTTQHNDIQMKFPTPIASLSKYVQTVEGWLQTGPLRRNAGRNPCAKVRKSSKSSPSNVVKKSMGSILKQPTTRSKQGVLQGWGKIKKRQRGRRRQATKFLVIN